MTPAVPRATLLFSRLSALFTLLTVALGSVVCATRSGFDCKAWPGCYTDRFAPGPADIPAILVANPAMEMVHRVIAMTTGALLLVTAVLVLRLAGHRAVKALAWVAVGCAGVSAFVGRRAVLDLGVGPWESALDILAALVAMSLSLVVAVSLGRGRGLALTGTARAGFAAAIALVVMHDTALLSAGYRSFTRCLSWPILWLASDDNFGLQVLRTVLAVVALAAVVVAVRRALRVPRLRTHALVIAGLQVAVLALAVLYRATGADGGLLGIAFSLASVALVWATVLLGACAATAAPAVASPEREPDEEFSRA